MATRATDLRTTLAWLLQPGDHLWVEAEPGCWAGPRIDRVRKWANGEVEIRTVNGGRRTFHSSTQVKVVHHPDPAGDLVWVTSDM